MVKTIKPVVTVIENDEWQLLILGITLLIFLTVILYFTRYYYKQNYQVSEEYDPLTNSSTPAVTAGSLKACSKGDCIVNLSTGLKKCPSNPDTILYYDITSQVCSSKSACPPQVPYAVNGDGSVNKYGTCENPDIPCKCTSEVTCPKYVISKFSVVNGNIYSSYASEKNFLLEQVPFSSDDSYNGNIKLDSSSEFCKINSSYSNQLVGGCSFLNQTNDFLMKCDKESLSTEVSASPYSLDPYYYGAQLDTQFCEVQPYLDSNWNNMTLCVNQNPCKIGNYTYIFDKYRNIKVSSVVNGITTTKEVKNNFVKGQQLNSRNFCQAYASNLDTYLTDLQYYTLSCTNGVTCNQLPNLTDENKFFSGENNELDISAINASYNVIFKNNTLIPQEKVSYNPFKNKLRSGDIVYNVTQKLFYVIRVNPWLKNQVTFYDITDTKVLWFNFYKYSSSSFPPASTDQLTYYPQYALNGFNYNTISNNNLNILNSKVIEDGKNAIINSYKIGNIKNSSITPNADVGGGYNPTYDITHNQTFYRGGLSKPRGYVFKEFEEEEATQEAIANTYNKASFNANNYQIKQTPFDTSYYNDISFYSPVWNNQYGRSECIRCNPLLVASINMAQISSQNSVTGFIYDAVTIQFSGQDFGHYRKNFLELGNPQKLWCYESRSKVDKDVISSPQTIYLERPNENIRVGDFVLSSNGEFNFKIVPVGRVPSNLISKPFYIYMGNVYQGPQASNFTPFYDYGTTGGEKDFFGLGIDNNEYQDFLKDSFITSFYDGKEFVVHNVPKSLSGNKFLSSSNNGGFLFGNKFTAVTARTPPESSNPQFQKFLDIISYESDKFFEVTIVPSVTVSAISENSAVITTTGFSSVPPFTSNVINPNSLIQFISKDRNLYLNNDPSDINKSLNGDNGVIQIDEITDKRITSIKVVESGSGYSNISPLVRLASYEPYFN